MSRRRSSRQNTTPIAVTVVALLLLAAIYICQQATGLDLGLSGTATPPPTPVVETPTGGSWYSLYFTDPDLTADLDDPSGGIPDAVAASFDAAQRTLDVAVYEFDLPVLSEALIRAAGRGVRVRVVTDTDTMGEATIRGLIEAGIPVVEDRRSAIMHDKFAVIDGVSVWTGSMNFTRNDAYRNNNNFIQITSTRLAQNYTFEFEEMFTERGFGPGPHLDTPNPAITLNDVRIENYFSPDDGVAAHLLDALNSARSSVHFMAFSFTRTDFADALIARARAGVSVQGVFETRQIAAGGDAAWNALTAAGLEVRQDGNPYNLHSKVFIVDRQIVVMGSYNFSRNAEENNDENVLILHSPEIAAAYLAEWEKVWEAAER
jgi:phosphatidylserine/phosphatidylglycerophosphate/cardiolipin synthase-like enzyme